MKIFLVFVLLFSLPALAGPVLNISCEKGTEYDYEISFEFDPAIQVETLTIKRKKQDYVQNLSSFQKNHFRLDLEKQGGIEGYLIEYRHQENGNFSTYEATLACQNKSDHKKTTDETEEHLSILKKSKAERMTGAIFDLDREEVYDEDLALEF